MLLLKILFPYIVLVVAAIGAILSMILYFSDFEKGLEHHDEEGHHGH
ncbi:MAG: hypothetical protein RMK52_02765 [Chitinophagales bacterium]|nr:hypothetical protein [Chitinophagales bacterium]MDW8393145.1 hypothetical protein [Chitinophagales bacterium]